MLLKHFMLVVFLLIVCHLMSVSSRRFWRRFWRRRQFRRRSPPPVDCQLSQWSVFKACDSNCSVGNEIVIRHFINGRTTERRKRRCSRPRLRKRRQCGSPNGGCDDICNPVNGSCSCILGYRLEADGKSCGDVNECQNGNGGCINSNCRNTDGSYWCDCQPGYERTTSRIICLPKLCSAINPPPCPSPTYHDEFGTACMPAQINCTHGFEYMESCSIYCDQNFKLAVIRTPDSSEAFAENFHKVDFKAPNKMTVCSLDGDNVKWDWNPNSSPYYCRRVNDPPFNISFQTLPSMRK
ncbi:matrilin-2-like [Xenia sp. Carnegie-2017]|uniref:matrilin-2-like n=1 Tax=Xenia sp. Carnegie-2017 TaxID=2897299 RepID=UPI001F047E06|nr:matrilin-2-like [Xenia sp. Carnegie-2017]